MSRDELKIKKLFTQDSELPQIVQEKKQEAYNIIYAQKTIEKNNKKSYPKRWQLPQAAVAVLAAIIVTGGTVAASAAILSYWERLKSMSDDVTEQYYEELQLSGKLAFQTNRPFTKQERSRYKELEKAYKTENLFPAYEITRLKEGEDYLGEGVCLMITDVGEEHILYLPETELTDEELLEIVEYLAKQHYANHETKKNQMLETGNWESRMAAMSDEEIDYYYLAFFTTKMEISDLFYRGTLNSETDEVLTSTEQLRYQQLEKEYEINNLEPMKEVVVIDDPADYSGTGVALCRYNASFYLPKRELTDEDMLQIIDFRRKAYYSLSRIKEEISLGYRTGYPKFTADNMQTTNAQAKEFANTDENGSLKTLAEARVGDIVQFGSYEQDNNKGNGKEAIEWYVLEASQKRLTLLSVKILDEAPYVSEQKNTTWQESDIREWLNTYFYKNAFNPTEQLEIVTTAVENEVGVDTEDKVYLLSNQEFLSYFGVNAENLNKAESVEENDAQNIKNLETLDARIFTEGTEAAHANGLWYWTEEITAGYKKLNNIDYSKANGNSTWWLRTMEESGISAYAIHANGSICSLQYVDSSQGIRPVVQIRR